MTDQHEAAAQAAAHIVNILDNDQPKTVQYGRILCLILNLIHAAQRHLAEPSEN